MELNIRLDTAGTKHLYEQIYEYIRDEIQKGNLKKDEKLPSTRALASYLHVARSTAELAYEQLQSEGYIRMKKNSGAYVCGTENITSLWEGAAPKAQQTGKEKEKKAPAGPPLIDFSPRKIDMSFFPYATWRRILRGLMAGERSEIFSRGDPRGDASFRETIAHYLHLSRQVHCSPDQILVGAGNDYLLMLFRYLLGENRRIAMEDPTYLRACRIFRSIGWEVDPVLSDESGMSARSLEESGCSVCYCMPAHQYPMGVVMPYTRRMELLSWAAADPDRYIIEDDYDSEFRYRGKPVPALQSADRAGKVIYIGTFSKSIAPAIRVSFLVLPPALAARSETECSFLSQTVSRIDQSILEEFIRQGSYERYLNRMRNRYRAKHDLMLDLLAPFRKKFRISGEGAGLHLVLTLKGTQDPLREYDLAEKAEKEGVKVYPLHDLYIPDAPLPEGQKEVPAILLGFAALSEDQIREGMEKLKAAFL